MNEEHVDEGEETEELDDVVAAHMALYESGYDENRALARLHYKDQNELGWEEANALWEGLPLGHADNPLGDPAVEARLHAEWQAAQTEAEGVAAAEQRAAERANDVGAQESDAARAAADAEAAAADESQAQGVASGAEPSVAGGPVPDTEGEQAPGADEGAGVA